MLKTVLSESEPNVDFGVLTAQTEITIEHKKQYIIIFSI